MTSRDDKDSRRELSISDVESWEALLEMFSDDQSLLQGAAGEDAMSVADVRRFLRELKVAKAVCHITAARPSLGTLSDETRSRAEDTLRAREQEGAVPGLTILTIDFWRARALYLAEQIVRTPVSPLATTIPLIKRISDQRDALYDALGDIMRTLRAESGSTDPMEAFAYDAAWEKMAIAADKALAAVPRYSDRLDNIFKAVAEVDDPAPSAVSHIEPKEGK